MREGPRALSPLPGRDPHRKRRFGPQSTGCRRAATMAILRTCVIHKVHKRIANHHDGRHGNSVKGGRGRKSQEAGFNSRHLAHLNCRTHARDGITYTRWVPASISKANPGRLLQSPAGQAPVGHSNPQQGKQRVPAGQNPLGPSKPQRGKTW